MSIERVSLMRILHAGGHRHQAQTKTPRFLGTAERFFHVWAVVGCHIGDKGQGGIILLAGVGERPKKNEVESYSEF